MSKRSILYLLPVLTGIALSGCGGGGSGGGGDGSQDPLAAYKSQKPLWGSCEAYFSRYSDNEEPSIYRDKLGSRLQCADIDAPLDYDHPDGMQIKISALRILADGASGNRPHLFFNPGGPGGDGRNMPLHYSQLLSLANPDTALGAMYRKMNENYNLIGFSPRGVGASTTIVCTGKESLYPIDRSAAGENQENIRRLQEQARYKAVNCQKNPVSDFINTDATARDMDLMRHVLGDEKLNYYGVSYGTWLGFWYAGLFPDRVGAMVMDSSMNFSRTFHESDIAYAEGQLHTFLNLTAPYAARHHDRLGLGSSVQEITARLNQLTPTAKQMLAEFSFRAEPKAIASSLLYTRLVMDASDAERNGASPESIVDSLSQADVVTGVPEIDLGKSEVAANIVSRLSMLKGEDYWRTAAEFEMDNSDSVYNTVACNDEPLLENDPAVWIRKGFELARSLPVMSNTLAAQPCIYWHRKVRFVKPSMASLKAANILMVQSQYDVPTPLAGAMETFNQLPAASMVYVKNEGSHGLMIYQTECVDLAVMNYLLGQAPARRMTECEGKPLPLDAQAPNAGARRPGSAPDGEQAHFEDPEQARQLIARLRKGSAGPMQGGGR